MQKKTASELYKEQNGLDPYVVLPPRILSKIEPKRCADCGLAGERTGHQYCQYPQDH